MNMLKRDEAKAAERAAYDSHVDKQITDAIANGAYGAHSPRRVIASANFV